jgi:uncharacterized protein (TIGR00290 family)
MNWVAVSWSSGKDSAWLLQVLRQTPDVNLVSLVTTFDEATRRVGMHSTREELVQSQAHAAGLPLWSLPIPWPCPNVEYERRMRSLLQRCAEAGVTQLAFGDLYLEEIRDYRIRLLDGSGIEPVFPIWCGRTGTAALAREMIASGLQATLTCLDLRRLDRSFLGASFDEELLSRLPPDVDPCGENGEFHTYCHTSNVFSHPISIQIGPITERDGFAHCDILAAT